MTIEEKTPAAPPADPIPAVEAAESEESELQTALAIMAGDPPPDEPTAEVEAAPADVKAAPTDPDADPAPDADPEGPASKGWAAVTKAQKKIEDERQALKAERHEISQLKTQAEQLQAGQTDFQAQLKADPFAVLQQAGVPFETLAREYLTGQPENNAEAPTADSSEIAALRAEVTAMREARSKDQSQANFNEYKGNLETAMAGDEYELVRTMPSAVDTAVQIAVRHNAQYGEILSPKQVIDTMQEEYRLELTQLKSSAAIRKVLGLADLPPSDVPTPPSQPAATPAAPSQTLTNNMTSSTTPPAPLGDLSEDDELELASKMITDDDWSNTAVF